MRTLSNDEELKSIQELIQRSELQGIEFHEFGAKKLGENKQREPNEDSIDVSLQVKHHVESDGFGVLLEVTLHPYMGEISVSVAAEYAVSDGELIDDHTVRAFGNEVAVMILFPYLREAVSTLSARLWNKPFTMPTFERGAVGFDLDDQ